MQIILSHPLQTISGVENNRRQDNVEENLRIKCRLEIDFINVFADKLSSERVSISSILGCCGVVERSRKFEPQAVGRQTLIVTC